MMNILRPWKVKINTLRYGIFLLPNSITAACLISGFYAIIFATQHQYKTAAMCIIIAGIADLIDGRVARLTNTQSEFGKKLDSIADMVAFGVAPPIFAYKWVLSAWHALGTIIAVMYTLSVALRLARFSVQPVRDDNFLGLPCPPTSCLLAFTLWLDISNPTVISGIMILLSILMVSSIQYRSFKAVKIKEHIVSITILMIFTMLMAIYIGLPQALFIIVLIFVLSGPVFAIARGIRLII